LLKRIKPPAFDTRTIYDKATRDAALISGEAAGTIFGMKTATAVAVGVLGAAAIANGGGSSSDGGDGGDGTTGTTGTNTGTTGTGGSGTTGTTGT
jgi:hypothetical protein